MNHDEYIEKSRRKVQEHFEYICLVDNIIESFELDASYPSEVHHYYNARIDSDKDNFILTISSDSSILAFIEARDNTSTYKCKAILITKIEPTQGVKDRVNMHNISNKENMIYLISGDTEEKLRKDLTDILKVK